MAFAPRVARASVYAVSAHRLRAIQALFHISRTRCLALRLGHSRVTNNKSKKRKSINASHFSTAGEMADSSDDGCNKGPWTEDEDIELSRLQVRETPFFSSSLPTPFHPYSQTHSRAHERTNQQTFTRHATAHVALTRKRVWVAHRRLPPNCPLQVSPTVLTLRFFSVVRHFVWSTAICDSRFARVTARARETRGCHSLLACRAIHI